MKKLTIHFSKVQITLMPACNGHFSGNGTGKLAKLDIREDPWETDCGNCKRTTAWKKAMAAKRSQTSGPIPLFGV